MAVPLRRGEGKRELKGQKNFFSRLKLVETDFDIFFSQQFFTKRAKFLGKYFKKPVNDYKFSH